MFHTSISWGGKITSFEASKECVEDVSLVTPHFIHHSGLNYDHRVSGLESLWPAAVLRLSALLQETKEIIALDRQGTQQQGPESPTVTPPGVRVNTRYKNSTKGTCSKQNKKKECPQWQIYPPFRHTRRQVCTGLFLFETGHRPCPSSAVIFLGSLIRQSCSFLDVEALWCMTKTLSPIERGTWAYV